MLHFLCGAVAAQRLAVAMEHERTLTVALRSFENAPNNWFSFAAVFVFRRENQAVPLY